MGWQLLVLGSPNLAIKYGLCRVIGESSSKRAEAVSGGVDRSVLAKRRYLLTTD
jgi:hypothetical protein